MKHLMPSLIRGRSRVCGHYPGAQDVRRGGSAGADQVEARKKALGAREFNSLHFKIRVYVEHYIHRSRLGG